MLPPSVRLPESVAPSVRCKRTCSPECFQRKGPWCLRVSGGGCSFGGQLAAIAGRCCCRSPQALGDSVVTGTLVCDRSGVRANIENFDGDCFDLDHRGRGTRFCEPGSTCPVAICIDPGDPPSSALMKRGRLQVQLIWRSMSSQYALRSLYFWSLPVAVRASSSRKSTDVGHL